MLRAYASGRLFGESYGKGDPVVVALHGWRRTHQDFDGVLASPGAPPAIALDLPGFGATPAPDRPWGSPQYAEAVAGGIEELGAPVTVLGHSLGGRIAVELAARRPELVASLVLTGAPLLRPAGRRPRPPLRYRALRRLASSGLVPPARLESARQRYGSADYRAAEGVMRDVLVTLLAEDYAPALAAIRCPLRLVWGSEDTAAPLEVARAIVERVPGATLTVLEGVGHLVPTEAPEALREALTESLP